MAPNLTSLIDYYDPNTGCWIIDPTKCRIWNGNICCEFQGNLLCWPDVPTFIIPKPPEF
jgi:hypothetical protein